MSEHKIYNVSMSQIYYLGKNLPIHFYVKMSPYSGQIYTFDPKKMTGYYTTSFRLREVDTIFLLEDIDSGKFKRSFPKVEIQYDERCQKFHLSSNHIGEVEIARDLIFSIYVRHDTHSKYVDKQIKERKMKELEKKEREKMEEEDDYDQSQIDENDGVEVIVDLPVYKRKQKEQKEKWEEIQSKRMKEKQENLKKMVFKK